MNIQNQCVQISFVNLCVNPKDPLCQSMITFSHNVVHNLKIPTPGDQHKDVLLGITMAAQGQTWDLRTSDMAWWPFLGSPTSRPWYVQPGASDIQLHLSRPARTGIPQQNELQEYKTLVDQQFALVDIYGNTWNCDNVRKETWVVEVPLDVLCEDWRWNAKVNMLQ